MRIDEGSRPALTYAGLLADTFDAMLHVVHVVPPLAREVSRVSIDEKIGPGAQEDGRRQPKPLSSGEALERRLDKFAAECLPGTIEVSTDISTTTVDEFLEGAKHRYDLVVLGTHDRSWLERLFSQSMATAAIQRLTCPVLAVPDGLDVAST